MLPSRPFSARTRADQKLLAARDHERRPAAQRTGFLRRLARKRVVVAGGQREAILD